MATRQHLVQVCWLVGGVAGVVGGAPCAVAGLASSLDYFRTLPVSAACGKAGPWGAAATPMDFLSTYNDDLSAACLISSCRTDFDTSASNFQAIACDEAAQLGSSLAGVRNFCRTFALTTTSPRCTDADAVDLGPLTAPCFGLVPRSTQLADVVSPDTWASYAAGVCNATSCVTSMLNRINTLSDCYFPWPALGGAPVSPKGYYKATVNSMCSLDICTDYYWWSGQTNSYLCTWQPPTNVTGSCAASLGAIYATAVSTACATAAFNGTTSLFLLQSTVLSSEYSSVAEKFAAIPTCVSDVLKVQRKLTSVANCISSELSFAINTFVQVVTSANTTTSNPLCTASESNGLLIKLNHATAVDCSVLSDRFVVWWDVLVPDQVSDLAIVAKSVACWSAAMAYANSFPTCEYVDVAKNEVATGVSAVDRFSSFLLAAQGAANPPPPPTPSRTLSPSSCFQAKNYPTYSFFNNVTLSAACVRVGPWTASAKPTDFLKSLSEFIPFACSQSACRNDIDTSASNWQSISCDEAQAFGSSLRNVYNLCKTLTLSPGNRTCTDTDSTTLGGMTSQCFGLVPTATSLVDIVLPASVSSYATTLCNQTCLTSVLNRIDTLSECALDWPTLGGAPVVSKELYKAYVNAMCNLDLCQSVNYWYYGQSTTTYVCNWTPPSSSFSSCSSKLAALYTTPFSPACLRAAFNDSYVLVVQYVVQGNYEAHTRAMHPTCILDVAAVTNKLSAISPSSCALSLQFAFETLMTVLTSTKESFSFTSATNSTWTGVCNSTQVTALIALLDAPAPRVCSKTNPAVILKWWDVYLPFHLADLAWVGTSPSCVWEATTYLNSFPSCEWVDTLTEQAVGTSVASRVGRFLLATQKHDFEGVNPFNTTASTNAITLPTSGATCGANTAAFTYYQNVPLSSTCVGPWPATATAVDLLSSSFLPAACAQNPCRQDIVSSAANFQSIGTCNASQTTATSLTKLGTLCSNLTVTTNSTATRCTVADRATLVGSVPSECFGLVPSASSLLDLVLPVNLTVSYNRICASSSCVTAILNRIDSLPACWMTWDAMGGAPIIPKALYKSYVNAMCSLDLCVDMNYWWYYGTPTKYLCSWSSSSTTSSSSTCASKVAVAYTTPFSSSCVAAVWPNQTQPRTTYYVLQQAIQNDYFYLSRKLMNEPSCKLDVAAMASQLDSIASFTCAGSTSTNSILLGIKTIQTVLASPITPQEDLAVCTASEMAVVRDRLSLAPSSSCPTYPFANGSNQPKASSPGSG
ncbi:hypothetical protein DYB37_005282 [Aphanomyces astaci]|uniref:Uncharacterized protein n=1 Tax=Aphanomyces astaci TaxID=112090 RepID=A0A418EPV2_APHAT|nr:hypothetical protein DYB37_005282 [Aphanomyces astaci]